MWQNRHNKSIARDYVLDGLTHLTHSLWLPGEDCVCIQQAIQQGIVDKKSTVYLVERDHQVYQKIQRKLHELKLHKKTNIQLYHSNLEDLELPVNFDFVFADLLGSFTPRILLWMSKLSNQIHQESRICFSHTYKVRNNDNFDEIKELCHSSAYKGIYQQVENYWNYNDEFITLPAFELKCCFSNWDFVIKRPFHYQDSQWGMIVYRCEDFHEQKQCKFPKIEEVLSKTKLGKREIETWQLDRKFNSLIADLRKYWQQNELTDQSENLTKLYKESVNIPD